MIIVVDTNIAIAAILKRSTTQEILFNPELEPYAPEFIGEEIIKHRQELMKKSGDTENKFYTILSLVLSRITIVREEKYAMHKEYVLKFTPDKMDWPFLALAKNLNAVLWTNDRRLREGQNEIRIVTTEELVKLLKI